MDGSLSRVEYNLLSCRAFRVLYVLFLACVFEEEMRRKL
jgi:hypothetical protein